MKIAIISANDSVWMHGMRDLSAFLCNNGHETKLVFLKFIVTHNQIDDKSSKILDELVNLVSDCDLIGITCVSNGLYMAKQIISKVKKNTDIPVIWGGVYATLNPEDCLKYSDFVCVGDGEDCLLELANKLSVGDDLYNIKNLWFKKDNIIYKNEVRPLIKNLDVIPFPDYNIDNHWILRDFFGDSSIAKFEEIDFFEGLINWIKLGPMTKGTKMFLAHTVRGCNFSCSFCCNKKIKDLYGNNDFIRKKSVHRIIQELLYIKNRFSHDILWFTDDSFFMRSVVELSEFSILYKKNINLPFICYANPVDITEEKLDILLYAGLNKVEMGIQTASSDTKELYNRKISNSRIFKAATILNNRHNEMDLPEYQVIFSNPYEKREDLLDTLSFLDKLPKPFFLQPFPLVFFPGSTLYDRAIVDGIINDEETCSDINYHEFSANLLIRSKKLGNNLFWNYLIRSMNGFNYDNKYGRVPKFLFNFLIKYSAVEQLSSLLKIVILVSSKMFKRDTWIFKMWLERNLKLNRDLRR